MLGFGRFFLKRDESMIVILKLVFTDVVNRFAVLLLLVDATMSAGDLSNWIRAQTQILLTAPNCQTGRMPFRRENRHMAALACVYARACLSQYACHLGVESVTRIWRGF